MTGFQTKSPTLIRLGGKPEKRSNSSPHVQSIHAADVGGLTGLPGEPVGNVAVRWRDIEAIPEDALEARLYPPPPSGQGTRFVS